MPSFLQDNWKYISGALFIHVLLAVLVVGMAFTSRQTIVPQLAIHAVMVDRATLNRLAQQAQPQPKPAQPSEDEQRKQQEEQAKQQELKRQQEAAEKQKAAEEEQQRQQKLKEQQRQDQLRVEAEAKQKAFEEQQRAQEAQRQQALQRQQAEAQAKQQAEQKRLADIQQKQREAEQKRQADLDAKAQAAREAELKQQLEMEEGRTQAVNSGLLNQYVALLNQTVTRNWTKPPSAKAGLECEVKVTQAAGGTVLSVQVGQCNGDQAVRQSIEAAVYRSSPLPAPPDPRLFDRNLTFVFKPAE